MKKLLEHNLEVMTGIFVVTSILMAIFWNMIDVPHKAVLIFAIVITLHEWEETRFPGGFMKLFSKKLQVDMTGIPAWKLHIFQALTIVTMIALPFIFIHVSWVCATLFYLGVFECFIHIAGIFIMGIKKPYSPGMVTAIIMAIPSIYGIWYMSTNELVSGVEWIYAFLLFFVLFMTMEQLFLRKAVGIHNIRKKLREVLKNK